MRRTVYLFDIDGTLVDAGGSGRLAMDGAFEERFGRQGILDGLSFGGMTDRGILREGHVRVRQPFDDEAFDRLIEVYLRHLERALATDLAFRVLAPAAELVARNTARGLVALDGEGHAEEYPGGYSDYLRQRKESSAAPRKQTSSTAPKSERTSTQSKLSYKDARALEELQARMPALETEISELEKMLADPDLYARDADLFHKTTERHDTLKAELEAAEERWLELEMKREELEGS